jgi:lysophospholipase L1-like esterase
MATRRRAERAHRVLRTGCFGIALLAAAGCGGGGSGATGPSVLPAKLKLEDAPKRVTAFGDSITVGFLGQERQDFGLLTANNYPVLLQRKLQTLGPGWLVINRGLGGEETEGGVVRLPAVLEADQPGIVLIMEGTNDARKCWSADNAVRNLRTMVRTAKRANAIPIIATVPPSFTSRQCTHEIIAYVNDYIRGFALVEGAVLAEIFHGTNNRALYGNDHLHPNQRGYNAMAEIWFQAIQLAIRGSTTVAQRRQR